MRFIEPFTFNRDNQDKFMVFINNGADSVRCRQNNGVQDEIYRYNIHETRGESRSFRESGVFRARSTNSRRGNKAAALHVNLGERSHRIFGKYNGPDHAILVFATLMRLLVNREGLLNKLRDYRDCRYEQAGRRCLPSQS